MRRHLGRRVPRLSAALIVAAGLSCTGGDRAPLPDGPTLGAYASAGGVESYNAATLYGYMDGGADAFLEYGFSHLWVRRYTRGSTQLIVELYAMRDAASASALYSSMRRAGAENELVAGCRGDIDATEVRVARGDRYLSCRNEDPLAQEDGAVLDLCTRILARLSGDCGVGSLFAALPSEGRVAGSEVALAGPIGLNQRGWLTPLGRQGFERGSLASYELSGAHAEVLFADYATPEAARAALAPLQESPRAGTTGLTRDRQLVLAFGESADSKKLADLVARLARPR